jgi:hypothetical protein
MVSMDFIYMNMEIYQKAVKVDAAILTQIIKLMED